VADEVRKLVIQFTGESDDAKGDIAAMLALLAEFDHVNVTADADVATAGAEANLAELFAALAVLDGTDVEIQTHFDTSQISLGTRLLNAFGLGASQADQDTKGFGKAVNDLNVNLPGMLGRLNLVSGAAFVLAAAIGVTLVGALGALVASLGAALAGLGALAAGFAAALGPAVLLVIGVVQRLAAVWKVLKASDDAQLQQEQARIQGNQQVVSALNQRHEAYLQLRRASEEVGTAEKRALLDIEDAAQRATDAILGLERAQLGQKEAALGIDRAKLELKKFIASMKVGQKEAAALFNKFTDVAFDPTKLNKALAKVKTPGAASGLDRQEAELHLKELILGVQDARLREKEATNAVTHAVTEKTRAEEAHLKFVREGIKASPQYIAALRAQADAHRAVKAAQGQVVNARTLAGQAKVQAMTDQLSSKEKTLLGILKQLRTTFNQVFGPGVQAIIMGIAIALGLINTRIKPLRGAFTTLGTAIGTAIVTLTDQLTSPQNIQAFANFATAAAAMVVPLTSIFGSILTIFLNIANVALPLLLPMLESVAGSFANLAANTGDMDKMSTIIGTLVEHFTVWWDIFKTLGQAFLQFLIIAEPFGLQLATAIDEIAHGLLNFVNSKEGRQQIQDFLAVAVPFAIRLAKFIGQVVLFLARLGEIAAPIIGPLLDLFSTMLGVSTRLLGVFVKISRAVGDLLTTFTDVVGKILTKLADFVSQFVKIGVDWVAGIIEGIAKKAKDLLKKAEDIGKNVLHKLSHPWELGSPSKVTMGYGKDLVEGLINGIEGASKRLAIAAEVSLQAPILDPLEVARRTAPHAAAAAVTAVGGGRGGDLIIEQQDINLLSAGGGNPDEKTAASRIARELQKSARKGRR
jgi:hypothetical protein